MFHETLISVVQSVSASTEVETQAQGDRVFLMTAHDWTPAFQSLHLGAQVWMTRYVENFQELHGWSNANPREKHQ